MPNVALRGVPEHVHRRIKDAARANHRSVNGEILVRLAASVSAERSVPTAAPIPHVPREPVSEEELRERARKRRAEIDARGGIDLSPEAIEALIQEGRRR